MDTTNGRPQYTRVPIRAKTLVTPSESPPNPPPSVPQPAELHPLPQSPPEAVLLSQSPPTQTPSADTKDQTNKHPQPQYTKENIKYFITKTVFLGVKPDEDKVYQGKLSELTRRQAS
jgi:hypothetical protein